MSVSLHPRRMIDLVRSGRSRREAAAIVAAEREEARRRLPPQPVHEVHPLAEQWLAVCRAPCEQYRHHGVAEYCELDACGDDGRRCVIAAVRTWTARLFGQAPPCEKQAGERGSSGAEERISPAPPLPRYSWTPALVDAVGERCEGDLVRFGYERPCLAAI